MSSHVLTPPNLTDADIVRFGERFEQREAFACWPWTGPFYNNGYGLFRVRGKNCRAHRISFFVANGTWPADKLVCHTCDNKRCVNPRHLWLGTHSDNAVDYYSKARASYCRPKTDFRQQIPKVEAYNRLWAALREIEVLGGDAGEIATAALHFKLGTPHKYLQGNGPLRAGEAVNIPNTTDRRP